MSRPTNVEARAAEIRANRRKKPGPIEQAGMKLTVDESALDRSEYHYRFVNDDANRIRQLQAQDYDIAPETAKEDSNSLGTANSALAGTDKEGRPFNTVLMRKHRVLFEDDLKEKQARMNAVDIAIQRGQERGGSIPGQSLTGEGVYTPGQNTIEVLTSRR